jgi:hypothetical protein
VNVQNPKGLVDDEKNDITGTWNKTSNNMNSSQVAQTSGNSDAKAVQIIRINYFFNLQTRLLTNFGGSSPSQGAIWVNPWFKLHFLPSNKDVGTNVENWRSSELSAGLDYPYMYRSSVYTKDGFDRNAYVEMYSNTYHINGPPGYLYHIAKNGRIVPTWSNASDWQGYKDIVPPDFKWWAPLAQEVRVLDLSEIKSHNSPRYHGERSEPGVIYSKVPILVFGNPGVPVTVVCEQNVYLKSINGYFPAKMSGEPVKILGTNDKPAVGIVSAEGVYVAPIADYGEESYGLPGGPRNIILNNVAIWTTKGFFSTMGYNSKMVLCGSVITMDSRFGKTYHKSYKNFGESFVGHNGTISPISGLGATDSCVRLYNKHGHMSFFRESFQYTRMFRGDDRKTRDIIEGPPPHLPVYFQKVRETDWSLEKAELYFERLEPFIKQNRAIPEGSMTALEKTMEELGAN